MFRQNFVVILEKIIFLYSSAKVGGSPRVVVGTTAFHARVWGSFPGLGGLKETKKFLPHPVSIVGSLFDREMVCSTSDRQGSSFESCVCKAVSSHHPQEVLLANLNYLCNLNRLWDGYLSCHQPLMTKDGGLRCRYACVGRWQTAPPYLYSCIEYISIYLAQMVP